MEFVSDLGLFAAKTVLIIVGFLVILSAIAMLLNRNRYRPQFEVEKLNLRFERMRWLLKRQLLSKKEWKAARKKDKKEKKKSTDSRSRAFVFEFNGDIRASHVHSLREEISAVLAVAQEGDEAIVRLESSGGMVHAYGLAASQLMRIKDRKLRLTVCVDKIAASGGYMMACVADRLIAAPFAVIGSIGVVASVPNFNRVLKKHDVEYREMTAGQYKRTVSVLGELTPQGLGKFQQQIEETHELFKLFVKTHRPQLDLDRVATGEHWYATQAIDFQLVDELSTSDDYLMKTAETSDVYKISFQGKKKLSERLSDSVSNAMHSLLIRFWGDINETRFGI